jgi:hypothetical protein
LGIRLLLLLLGFVVVVVVLLFEEEGVSLFLVTTTRSAFGPNLFKGEEASACWCEDKPALRTELRDDLMFFKDGGVQLPLFLLSSAPFCFLIEGDEGMPAAGSEVDLVDLVEVVVAVVVVVAGTSAGADAGEEYGEGGGDERWRTLVNNAIAILVPRRCNGVKLF